MDINTYIHTYNKHIHTDSRAYRHIHTYIHTKRHTYIHTNRQTYIPAYRQIHRHEKTHIQADIQT